MQQRQLRLGDILDDYCPRERRVTNHAVVAMVGEDVKQTRCTTCDAEHEYKHAKVPRQRRKTETPAALYSQVLASGPKRVAHEDTGSNGHDQSTEHAEDVVETTHVDVVEAPAESVALVDAGNGADQPIEAQAIDAVKDDAPAEDVDEDRDQERDQEEEGPVHRPLIRASLPRPEGQPPQTRPIPEFTIRQPGGRPNRFRPRHQRGGQQGPHGNPGHHFQGGGNRSNGNMGGGPPRGGMRPGGGRPPQGGLPRMARRHGPPGRKRSK